MAVSFNELLEAFDFVNFGSMGEHQAFLCRQTGKVYWHSEFLDDEFDELPEDVDDDEKYIQVPDKRETPRVASLARPRVNSAQCGDALSDWQS